MPWCLSFCFNVEIDSWRLNIRSRSTNSRYIKSFPSVRKKLQNWASYKYDVLSFNDINVVVRLTIISIYSAKIFTISYSYFTKRLAWNKTTKKVEYFSCQWNQFWMPVWRILWPCNNFLWGYFIPIFCRIKNE